LQIIYTHRRTDYSSFWRPDAQTLR